MGQAKTEMGHEWQFKTGKQMEWSWYTPKFRRTAIPIWTLNLSLSNRSSFRPFLLEQLSKQKSDSYKCGAGFPPLRSTKNLWQLVSLRTAWTACSYELGLTVMTAKRIPDAHPDGLNVSDPVASYTGKPFL